MKKEGEKVTEMYINKGRLVAATKYHRSAPSFRELNIYSGKAKEDPAGLAIDLECDCEFISDGDSKQKKFALRMPLILAEKPNGGHYLPFANVLRKDESAGRLYGLMVPCLVAGYLNLKTSYANHGIIPVQALTKGDKMSYLYQLEPDRYTNEMLFYTDSPDIIKTSTKPVMKLTIGETTLYVVSLSIEEVARAVGSRKMDGPKLRDFLKTQLYIKEDISYYSKRP